MDTCKNCPATEHLVRCARCGLWICPSHRAGTGSLGDGYTCIDDVFAQAFPPPTSEKEKTREDAFVLRCLKRLRLLDENQKRTLHLIAIAFLLGLAVALLGCAREGNVGTPDAGPPAEALDGGSQAPGRGPGPGLDAVSPEDTRNDVRTDSANDLTVLPRDGLSDTPRDGLATDASANDLTAETRSLPIDTSTGDAREAATAEPPPEAPRDAAASEAGIPDSSSRPDLPQDLTRSPLGTTCSSGPQCGSGYCTDGVCCTVVKCIDTCDPAGGSACPIYNGWTCAPYGTCRAY